MAVNEDLLQYICDQLNEFGTFDTKRMFGGVGFFREGIMFGMIGKDIFGLKIDEESKADYIERGMKPYTPSKKGKGMPYYEVPPEVLEDRLELKKWADKAYDIALKAKKK